MKIQIQHTTTVDEIAHTYNVLMIINDGAHNRIEVWDANWQDDEYEVGEEGYEYRMIPVVAVNSTMPNDKIPQMIPVALRLIREDIAYVNYHMELDAQDEANGLGGEDPMDAYYGY